MMATLLATVVFYFYFYLILDPRQLGMKIFQLGALLGIEWLESLESESHIDVTVSG